VRARFFRRFRVDTGAGLTRGFVELLKPSAKSSAKEKVESPKAREPAGGGAPSGLREEEERELAELTVVACSWAFRTPIFASLTLVPSVGMPF
jgi:hypothetical protein